MWWPGNHRPGNTNVLVFGISSAAAFAGLLLMGFFTSGESSAPPAAQPAPAPQAVPAQTAAVRTADGKGVGTLIGAKDCVWGESEMEVKQHARLIPGKLTLDKGVAEIRLDQGTVLILEGPAVFEIRTKNSALLHKGKLVAHVPQRAKGFQLETPSATIVDLGLDSSADPEDGEILHSGTIELKAGESLQVEPKDGGGTIRLGPGESQRFGPEPEAESDKSI